MPLTLDEGSTRISGVEKSSGLRTAGGMSVSELASATDTAMVPFVGRIAAGGPILADQVVEDVMPLPRQLVGHGELFMLKVAGDSMIDAAICDGDWVVVRRQSDAVNGEIVLRCWMTRPRSRRSASATDTHGCCRGTPSSSPSLAITPSSWARSSRCFAPYDATGNSARGPRPASDGALFAFPPSYSRRKGPLVPYDACMPRVRERRKGSNWAGTPHSPGAPRLSPGLPGPAAPGSPPGLTGGLPGFLREPLQCREGNRGVGGRPERGQCCTEERSVALCGEP